MIFISCRFFLHPSVRVCCSNHFPSYLICYWSVVNWKWMAEKKKTRSRSISLSRSPLTSPTFDISFYSLDIEKDVLPTAFNKFFKSVDYFTLLPYTLSECSLHALYKYSIQYTNRHATVHLSRGVSMNKAFHYALSIRICTELDRTNNWNALFPFGLNRHCNADNTHSPITYLLY